MWTLTKYHTDDRNPLSDCLMLMIMYERTLNNNDVHGRVIKLLLFIKNIAHLWLNKEFWIILTKSNYGEVWPWFESQEKVGHVANTDFKNTNHSAKSLDQNILFKTTIWYCWVLGSIPALVYVDYVVSALPMLPWVFFRCSNFTVRLLIYCIGLVVCWHRPRVDPCLSG